MSHIVCDCLSDLTSFCSRWHCMPGMDSIARSHTNNVGDCEHILLWSFPLQYCTVNAALIQFPDNMLWGPVEVWKLLIMRGILWSYLKWDNTTNVRKSDTTSSSTTNNPCEAFPKSTTFCLHSLLLGHCRCAWYRRYHVAKTSRPGFIHMASPLFPHPIPSTLNWLQYSDREFDRVAAVKTL